MAMDHAFASTPLPERLTEGFARLGRVLRAAEWEAGLAAGLTPTQAQALRSLRGRAGLRVKAIAAELAISAPSATDSLNALLMKGLIRKTPDAADARALAVHITPEGLNMLARLDAAPLALAPAFADLEPSDQADLLLLQIRMIRALQIAGAIPVQRMCVSCRHFRPNAHPGAAAAHHCAFVNAAFGSPDLRLDCGEHETADPAHQAATWSAFETGSANLRAANP